MTSPGPAALADDSSPAPAGLLAVARASVRESRDSMASVMRNPGLRRVELALTGSMVGDWAYATAVTVWAYGVGGVNAVGIWVAIRLTLMAFSAPVTAAFVDRMPRKRAMILADTGRAVLVSAAAVCLFVGTPPAPIFVLATLTALLGSPFRCAQRALMPALANNPEELTASNGASSTIESLSFFVGPAVGALLIGLTDVGVVFCLNALTFVWSLLLVTGIRVPHEDKTVKAAPTETDAAEEADESFLAEVSGGFRSIVADRDLLVVTALLAAQTIVAGASGVFLVAMAVEVLRVGAHGVGYLDSVTGIGSVLGGFVAIARASRNRLALDMSVGVLLWALPLVMVTIWASPITVFAAVALLGLANPLVDVNFDTIVQRITPEAMLGRVFGAIEASVIATMALGAFLMPVLLHLWDLQVALAVIGIGVAALTLPFLPRMGRLDARLTAPAGLALLQKIPMFAPLAPSTVDGLARNLVEVRFGAGDVVLREGEDSDRFFVIESGLVEVTQGTKVLRREGPGEFFGEIGLLRDVPRTATITAVEDTVLQALGREDFLAAVTGQSEAASAADDIVSRRLTV